MSLLWTPRCCRREEPRNIFTNKCGISIIPQSFLANYYEICFVAFWKKIVPVISKKKNIFLLKFGTMYQMLKMFPNSQRLWVCKAKDPLCYKNLWYFLWFSIKCGQNSVCFRFQLILVKIPFAFEGGLALVCYIVHDNKCMYLLNIQTSSLIWINAVKPKVCTFS